MLSKINFNNLLKLKNQTYKLIDFENRQDFILILNKIKTVYEDQWKKINEINTSIKLPLTISIKSQEYDKIQELERVFDEIDLISNFFILKFDSQNIYYKIIYNGSPKSLINNITNRNFDLIMEDNMWTVK